MWSAEAGPRLCIATVCLSGTLEDKLAAAAAARFQSVELFERDLVASPWSPARVRQECDRRGLSIDLYQPFRDFEAVPPDVFAANLRRAGRVFDVLEQLGATTLLVTSSVSKSRNGWYRSMERPRSAHRERSSAADHGEATKSGSKISTPSKPASLAATSFWSRVPLRQTVAIDVRMTPSCGHRRWWPPAIIRTALHGSVLTSTFDTKGDR